MNPLKEKRYVKYLKALSVSDKELFLQEINKCENAKLIYINDMSEAELVVYRGQCSIHNLKDPITWMYEYGEKSYIKYHTFADCHVMSTVSRPELVG